MVGGEISGGRRTQLGSRKQQVLVHAAMDKVQKVGIIHSVLPFAPVGFAPIWPGLFCYTFVIFRQLHDCRLLVFGAPHQIPASLNSRSAWSISRCRFRFVRRGGGSPLAAAVEEFENLCSASTDVNRLPPIRHDSSFVPRAPLNLQRCSVLTLGLPGRILAAWLKLRRVSF